VAVNCGIDKVADVENIVATLELFPEFLRSEGTCSQCGRTGLPVTHAV
jgi:hypothetical protein